MAETNALFRKKYFIDSGKVVPIQARGKDRPQNTSCRVIDASKVIMSNLPVVVHGAVPGGIRVDTVREGNKISRIRISCACGRTAEMAVHYDK